MFHFILVCVDCRNNQNRADAFDHENSLVWTPTHPQHMKTTWGSPSTSSQQSAWPKIALNNRENWWSIVRPVSTCCISKRQRNEDHTQTHRFPFQPVQIREWGSLSAPSSQVGGQQWRVKVRPTFPVIRSGPGRCSLTDKEQWGWRGSSLYNRPPRCRCVLCKWKKQVEERKEGLKRGNVNIS